MKRMEECFFWGGDILQFGWKLGHWFKTSYKNQLQLKKGDYQQSRQGHTKRDKVPPSLKRKESWATCRYVLKGNFSTMSKTFISCCPNEPKDSIWNVSFKKPTWGTLRCASVWGSSEVRLKDARLCLSSFLLFLGLVFNFFFFPWKPKDELCLYGKCVHWGTTITYLKVICSLSSYIDV